MSGASRKITHVAVGVLVRNDGAVLLADRPHGKPYAGYWEFPGGKIEAGETVTQALARELHEELGIDIAAALPWVTFEHDYPHAYVRLHFCRVFEWRGTPHAREGQRIEFVAPDGELPAPLLPAAVPALRWLKLSPIYAISNAAELGRAEFLRRLDRALARGVRLIQLREPALHAEEVAALLADVLTRARAHRATVLVNSRHPQALWRRGDGVHLTAADLMRTAARPDAAHVAASIHTREELRHAASIGCEFCVAGPVLATPTHPNAPTLGWEGLAALIEGNAVPVYAIGGQTPKELPAAMRAGAHGVALLRAAWAET
jgi:8-oxo-dGTP diphosphatase